MFILFFMLVLATNCYAADVDYYYEEQSTAAVTYRYESTPGAPTYDADTLDGEHGSYYLVASSGAQVDTNTTNIALLKTNTGYLQEEVDSKLPDNADVIKSSHIAPGTLDADVIASSVAVNKIGTSNIIDSSIVDADINDIAPGKISAGAMDADVIAGSIAVNSVGTTNIINDAVDDDKIDFSDVTGADITLTDNSTIQDIGTSTQTNKTYSENVASSTGPLVYQSYNSSMYRNENSTNTYTNGYSSATTIYGDISNCTGGEAGVSDVYGAISFTVPGHLYSTADIQSIGQTGYDFTISSVVVSVNRGTPPEGAFTNFDIVISTVTGTSGIYPYGDSIFASTFTCQLAAGTTVAVITTFREASIKKNWELFLCIGDTPGTTGDPTKVTVQHKQD